MSDVSYSISKKKSNYAKKFNYVRTVMMFLSPAILFYLIFIVYPVIKSLFFSFYRIEVSISNTILTFVGLDNFKAVLEDPVFWKAAKNTLIWAFSSPFLEIPLGLLLAMVLRKGTKSTKFFRVVWFAPVLIPHIVCGIIWAWIYNSDWGILNKILNVLYLGFLARPWLGESATALPALIFVTTWIFTGFNMVILLAAVSSIPQELLESSHIDGAKSSQVLFKIIIPLMRPVIVNLMILCFIGKMKVFDLIWATTQGGPMWATETVATYTVKRAFYWNTFEKGYPCAMATMWFLIILVISVTITLSLRKKEMLEY